MEHKRLYGLQAESNIAANQLQDTLGIEFANKPRHALLTPRNKLLIALNGWLNNDLALFGISMMLPRTTFGVYAPEYHTYFSRKPHQFCELHENAHGLSNVLNPELFKTMRKNHLAFTSPDKTYFDPERFVTTKSFVEGVAQWSAIKVASAVGDEDTKRVALFEHNRMYGVTGDRNKVKPTKYTTQELKKMRGVVKKFLDAPDLVGSFKHAPFLGGLIGDIEEGIYAVGFEFTRKAMSYLVENGADTSKGLKMLHANPPKSLDDLSRPRDFVKSL